MGGNGTRRINEGFHHHHPRDDGDAKIMLVDDRMMTNVPIQLFILLTLFKSVLSSRFQVAD